MGVVGTGSITLYDQNDITYAVLTSDVGLVPVDANGAPKTPLSITPLSTTMKVYRGNTLQAGWSFSRTNSGSQVTSSVNSSGVLTVTDLTSDTAWVDIVASKLGQDPITKRYLLSKVYQGEVGVEGPKGDVGEAGPQGPQGPMGNPGAVGVNTDGAKIQVGGFDDDGAFGSDTGIIYNGSTRITVSFTEYTCTVDGSGYIVLINENVGFCKLSTVTIGSGENTQHRMAWKSFNTADEVVPNLVIGNFFVSNGIVVDAEIITPRTPDSFLKANLMKVLMEAGSADDNTLKTTAMAMGADRVFQTIVAMEAFIRDLYVRNIESDDYAQNAEGYPTVGYKLGRDRSNNAIIAKIAELWAYNAKIFGDFYNNGFKTLSPFNGTTITGPAVSKSIFKFSDAYNLIPDSNTLQSLSGTFEGFSFTQATRRSGKRILLTSDTTPSSATVGTSSSSDFRVLKRAIPSQIFGSSFYIEWHISYNGNMGQRLLLRCIAGANVRSEWYYSITYQNGVDSDGDPNYVTEYPNQQDMILWRADKGSGTYSATYGTNERKEICVIARSGALWGEAGATCNYLNTWTSSTFSSDILVNGSNYTQVIDQPNKYYLSSLKTFDIGGTTQDSASIKKYVSGTDFYNYFSVLPVGAIGAASAGEVNYNGTHYPVTRLQKTANSIIIWSGSTELVVNKFQNGTNIGVYTHLEITQPIVFGAVSGGIETMHILPFSGANKLYDLGQSEKRFRDGYFRNVISDSFNASSKRSLKKNIRKYKKSALKVLKDVEVVTYQYKTEKGKYKHTGFIADDAPDCLTGADHDVMALSDNVGMLIKAVQELDARLEKLEVV